MQRVNVFDAGHDDLIHDIAYDYFGTKLVTCSSDHRIKVWEADQNFSWTLNDAWKAHDSSVVKATWAHPEFGQLFASCSFDKTVRIWEEQEHEHRQSGRRWIERAKLADSKGSVHDIEFAPNHFGLKLATAASDGIVRIYEAMDVVNLSQWTPMDDFEILSSQPKDKDGKDRELKESENSFSLSWCHSRTEPQMMVVGCGRENTARIFRVNSFNKWQAFEALEGHTDMVNDVAWAPNMGR
eukprot:jgi/Hompol1/6652/HPOL_005044-RA